MNLKKYIMNMIPIAIARKAYLKCPSVVMGNVLKEKAKRLILSNPKKIEDILINGEYIVIEKSCNRYSSLNMCYINDMLGGSLLALGLGYVPYFHVPYFESENETLEKNKIIHDDYFLQLFAKNKKDIVIQATDGLGYLEIYDKKEVQISAFLYHHLFILNEDTKKYVTNDMEKIRMKTGEKRVLGVSCRGTDFLTLKPKGHPIQPSVDQILEKVKQYTERYEYIYITSEEERVIKIFEEAFPGKIVTNSRKYYDELFFSKNDVTHITQIEFDRENDRYLRGLEYYSSVYILSQCDALIGGNCGATRAALYMNDLKYEEKYIFDLGLYT